MRKAVTIGELLITMSIIGVIAILVLPGFLKDYHKKVYTTKLQKTVEQLENAINQSCIDNNVSYFNQTPYTVANKEKQQEFLNKYFKVAKKIDEMPFAPKYKSIQSGTEMKLTLSTEHGWAKLVSGEAVSFYCSDLATHCVFRVDTNSTDGPNVGGRDFFMLFIDKATNKIFDQEDKDCVGQSNGSGCYHKLIENNWVMDY